MMQGSRPMNDLDTLMRRIEDINAKPAIEVTATDINDLIKYHRSPALAKPRVKSQPSLKPSIYLRS